LAIKQGLNAQKKALKHLFLKVLGYFIIIM